MSSQDNKNESKQITVIVVDDDIDTLDVFCEYLEISNFRVVGKAYSGERVAELYSKSKPDVVFLDVMMDNYDGIYALEQIRKINPDAVVIMVTADLTKETADKLENLQASSIIYKPFDIKNIIKSVESILDSRKNIEPVSKQPELLSQSSAFALNGYAQELLVSHK